MGEAGWFRDPGMFLVIFHAQLRVRGAQAGAFHHGAVEREEINSLLYKNLIFSKALGVG